MISRIGSLLGRKPAAKSGSSLTKTSSAQQVSPPRQDGSNKQIFSKVFRWRLPQGQVLEPATVEVVGSFTGWRKMPMLRDRAMNTWHTTISDIPGNRTHHYMLLVDGQPVYDHTCDGLAVPQGFEEKQFELMTPRGPRLLLLFSQTK
jgi:hypothetical protein